jgi:hypothetical protein
LRAQLAQRAARRLLPNELGRFEILGAAGRRVVVAPALLAAFVFDDGRHRQRGV